MKMQEDRKAKRECVDKTLSQVTSSNHCYCRIYRLSDVNLHSNNETVERPGEGAQIVLAYPRPIPYWVIINNKGGFTWCNMLRATFPPLAVITMFPLMHPRLRSVVANLRCFCTTIYGWIIVCSLQQSGQCLGEYSLHTELFCLLKRGHSHLRHH